VRQLTEDVRKLKEDIQSLQQLNAQLTEERSMAVENVRQVTAVNDQLTGELSELNKDKQSLQQEVNRLSEDTATKTAQLCYKQRAIDTLRHEFEQVKAEKGVLQQRIDDMEILLRNAESASEAAEKRLTDRKEVLKVPLGDVQLSAKKLGSGAFGGVRVGYWRGCPVAVKRLHEELAKELYQRSLFEQEVEVISRLHHPNIAAICGVINKEDTQGLVQMNIYEN
jgi:chromosome segregation ATPase